MWTIYHFLLLFLDFLLIFSHYSFSLSSSFFVLFLEIYIDIRFMFIVATIYLFSSSEETLKMRSETEKRKNI